MGLFGPGRPTADHTRQALAQTQSRNRIADANASTRPQERTLAEIQRQQASRR
jgi:hypothetical protein